MVNSLFTISKGMSKQAFSFSGDDALNYDQYLGPLLFEPASLELLAFAGDKDVREVLEISSGTGRLTRHLRTYFSARTRLVASDISRDMLDLARQNLNDNSIEYIVADAQQLPFTNNQFDTVIWQFGLMFLPDKLKGVQEAFRVLKPGGRFVFSTWDSVENMPLVDLIINKTIVSFFGGVEKAKFQVPFSLRDRETLLNFMNDAGFKKKEINHVVFKAGKSTPEDAVNGFLLKHPLGRTVAEKDPAALEPMSAALLTNIAEEFGRPFITADLREFICVGEK
jgi:ubiquinone/menaquinone biosynthesis C-methylase UbiE